MKKPKPITHRHGSPQSNPAGQSTHLNNPNPQLAPLNFSHFSPHAPLHSPLLHPHQSKACPTPEAPNPYPPSPTQTSAVTPDLHYSWSSTPPAPHAGPGDPLHGIVLSKPTIVQPIPQTPSTTRRTTKRESLAQCRAVTSRLTPALMNSPPINLPDENRIYTRITPTPRHSPHSTAIPHGSPITTT